MNSLNYFVYVLGGTNYVNLSVATTIIDTLIAKALFWSKKTGNC